MRLYIFRLCCMSFCLAFALCTKDLVSSIDKDPDYVPIRSDLNIPDSVWIDSVSYTGFRAVWNKVDSVEGYFVILTDGSATPLDTFATTDTVYKISISSTIERYMVCIQTFADTVISTKVTKFADTKIYRYRNPTRVYVETTTTSKTVITFTANEYHYSDAEYGYRAYIRDYKGLIIDSADFDDDSTQSITITGLTKNKAYKISLVTVGELGPLAIDSNCVYDTSACQVNAKRLPYVYVNTYETPAPVQDSLLVPEKGGIFLMGHCWDRDSVQIWRTGPVHEVLVSSFYMGKYEVTAKEYAEFLNDKIDSLKIDDLLCLNGHTLADTNKPTWPLSFVGDSFTVKPGKYSYPIQCLGWHGAAAYCNWLSQKEGVAPCYDTNWVCDFAKTGYRLPTEAEYEFTVTGASSGRKTRFSWGSEWNTSNAAVLKNGPDPVGTYASRNGIFDLTGNVIEYVNDWSDCPNEGTEVSPYYQECSAKGVVIDPRGPAMQVADYRHMMRGGSYETGINANIASYRYANPCENFSDYGFRVARNAP